MIDEQARMAALAQEHLPCGVASVGEFSDAFRRLVEAWARCERSQGHIVADVVAWLRGDGATHHYTALRWLESGRLLRVFEFAVAVAVDPSDLDGHAEGIASAFTQGLNMTEEAWRPTSDGSDG